METLAKEGVRNHKDPVWHALLHAIAYQELSEEDRNKIYNNEPTLDVEFRVNGVEVSFSKIITRFREIYRQCVEEDAKELVDRSVHDMIRNFCENLEEINERVGETVEKAFEEKLGRCLMKIDPWDER